MTEGAVQECSARLAARVDALARELEAAGVSEEDASRLLARASEAVLQAVTLELLVSERRLRRRASGPDPAAVVEPGPPAPVVRLAA
jgi:hypothetical protein